MDFLASMHTRVLKEPLGMMRCIEFFMSILAFATTCGYAACTTINSAVGACGDVISQRKICWSYPFKLHTILVNANCDRNTTTQPTQVFLADLNSSAEFYVFVGVAMFLWCLVSLYIYLFLWQAYESQHIYAYADFGVTGVLAFLMFVASCAWAAGVTELKTLTSSQNIMSYLVINGAPFPICKGTDPQIGCTLHGSYDYASLNVSLICGFACFGLLASNLWFIFKETAWFRDRNAASGPVDGMGGGAPTSGGFGANEVPRTGPTSYGPTPYGAAPFRQ